MLTYLAVTIFNLLFSCGVIKLMYKSEVFEEDIYQISVILFLLSLIFTLGTVVILSFSAALLSLILESKYSTFSNLGKNIVKFCTKGE
jgi:hypothetical protein